MSSSFSIASVVSGSGNSVGSVSGNVLASGDSVVSSSLLSTVSVGSTGTSVGSGASAVVDCSHLHSGGQSGFEQSHSGASVSGVSVSGASVG